MKRTTLEERFELILRDAAPVFHAPIRLGALVRAAKEYVAHREHAPWIEAWLRASDWP